MSGQLLMIAIGPVQDFIAQARRTRDLWHGSHLLSELSRYTARMLAESGAELIFPALDRDDEELKYTPDPWRDKERTRPALNVANVILAHVEGDEDHARELAETARTELFRFWREEVAEAVKKKVSAHGGAPGLLQKGTDDVWDEQIDTLLEFVAAWTELGDTAASYKEARDQLAAAIAGRKNLREFSQWQQSRDGAPKSSLDGARVSVLADKRGSELFRTYRIEGQEQLDAVGVVKRCGGAPEQFVPLTSIALASWLDEAADNEVAAGKLAALKNACGRDELKGLGYVWRDLPGLVPFKYDAAILLESRWQPVLDKELGLADWKKWANDNVRPLLSKMNAPLPYVACLVADGDRMGKTIDELADGAENGMSLHREFSKKLSVFAGLARDIVEQQHKGSLVYSGGDDVLAFLPLPEAVACAEALRLGFEELMAGAAPDGMKTPTLSVGIGIGHVQESMGELLELGKKAEKLAKGSDLADTLQRNALALVLDKRSGGVRQWRAQWSKHPAATLRNDTLVLKDGLSTRKVYQVAAMLARLPKPVLGEPGEDWALVLRSEVKRLLKRTGDKALTSGQVGLNLDGATYTEVHAEVSLWIDRVLIARFIAGATPAAKAPAHYAQEEVA